MSRHRFPNGSEETSQHGVTQQPQRSNVRLYSNSLWRFGYFDIFKAVSLPGSFWTTQEQFGVCVEGGGDNWPENWLRNFVLHRSIRP